MKEPGKKRKRLMKLMQLMHPSRYEIGDVSGYFIPEYMLELVKKLREEKEKAERNKET